MWVMGEVSTASDLREGTELHMFWVWPENRVRGDREPAGWLPSRSLEGKGDRAKR